MTNFDRFSPLIIKGKVCPYCFNKSERVDSIIIYGRSFGNIYLCRTCGAYVGTHHGDKKALGRLANSELRQCKKLAHKYFDTLWKKIN